MERVVGVWKCPVGFGVPIPGGAQGVSGFTGLGTGRSLDWVGLEVFSSLKDFGILCLHLGSHRDKRNTALRAGAAASLSSGNARICCRDQELLLFHSRLGMDFLTLFLIYLCFVLAVTALLCLCSGRKESFLTRSINRASQVLSLVIPTQLQRVTHQALHRLFHTRSCLFMVLHVALQAAVFGEYTWEVFVYCWELQFHLVLLLLPYLLLAGNLGCFLLCSRANPGTVTKSNAASLVKVYAYDGVLFQRGLVCPTCTVEKPARSKHCSVCRTCVHRFDHHCVWVNNCIGASNAAVFLLYLLSLTATAAAVAAVTAAFLIHVLLLSDIMHSTYLDAQGQEHPVEIPFLVQHLFLTFPRIVFMLGFVILLTLVLGGYCSFSLYLALTNQTTNEWCKSRRFGGSPHLPTQPQDRPLVYKNIYSKGIWRNLKEIFNPPTVLERKKKT